MLTTTSTLAVRTVQGAMRSGQRSGRLTGRVLQFHPPPAIAILLHVGVARTTNVRRTSAPLLVASSPNVLVARRLGATRGSAFRTCLYWTIRTARDQSVRTTRWLDHSVGRKASRMRRNVRYREDVA